MPPKLAKTLNYLEGEHGFLVQHLKDKFPPNTPDVEWIEKLSKEGDWFVITKDSNIKKSNHEKKAWEESGLQVVFLDKAWGKKLDFWEIAWRFIKFWPELKKSIDHSMPSTSFQLNINGKIKVL